MTSVHSCNAGQALQVVLLVAAVLLGWLVCGTIGISLSFMVFFWRVSHGDLFVLFSSIVDCYCCDTVFVRESVNILIYIASIYLIVSGIGVGGLRAKDVRPSYFD